jgi:serine/threonine protein kinase/tetratricopeptide (TPR) repeat protein/WD40 repeat protein
MSEQSIFLAALDIADPAERSAYLDQACGDDSEARQHIEELIAAQSKLGKFLDKPHMAPDVTDDLSPVTERRGMQIGPYKLLEQIGEGGFGVVFMAEQQQPVRRKVALKVLKPGMDTRQVVARFEAERQALALMDHPNIARVLDAGETASGRPYFVMELVKGIPITQFCDEGKLSTRERLELFVTVCQAAQHAHQKGIIHRDLKPTNVLVTLHDGTPVAKVIDFGVAKATGQQLTEKTLFTGFAQMVGTPLYMSPEQAALSGLDIDTRTDIYSLGVLLYELLTGTTPLQNERLKQAAFDEVRRLIREEEAVKPSTRISTLGATAVSISAQRRTEPNKLSQLLRNELDWIVMKALEKDRSRRYETASAFAADISRYLRDEQVEACPPSTLYRIRKFARRNRVVFTSAALVAAVLLTGLAVSISLAIVANRQRDRAEIATLGETEQRKAADAARLAEAAERATAERERDEAQKQRDKATALNEELTRQKEQQRRTLYATQMALVQKAWESGNPSRIKDLLNAVRPKPGETDLRGIEWYYWQRMIPRETRRSKLPITLTGQRERHQGRELLTQGDNGVVARFSDDGKVFAMMARSKRSKDNAFIWNVQVFSTESGKRVFSKELPGKFVSEAEIPSRRRSEPEGRISHLDGGGIAVSTSVGLQDELQLWDLRIYRFPSRDEVVTKEAVPLLLTYDAFAFSRDGSRFAAALSGPVVQVWDAQTGGEVAKAPLPSPSEGSADKAPFGVLLALNGDGTLVAMKRMVSLVDRDGEGNPIAKITPHGITIVQVGADKTVTTAPVNAQRIEFSPDGKRIAAFSMPNTANSESLTCTVFDDTDGRSICTVSSDRYELSPTFGVYPPNWFGFTNDGKWLAATSVRSATGFSSNPGTMKFWDSTTGNAVMQLEFGADDLMVAGFSGDGKLLTCDRKGTVTSWRLHPEPTAAAPTVAQEVQNPGPRFAANRRSLSANSPDGRWRLRGQATRFVDAPAAAAEPAYQLVLEDRSGAAQPRMFPVPGPLLGQAPEFSRDGKFVLAVVHDVSRPGRSAVLKVWQVESGDLRLSVSIPTATLHWLREPDRDEMLQLPSLSRWRVFHVAFSPDSQTVVAPFGLWPPDGLVAFDLNSGQRRWTINGRVIQYQFSGNGRRLVGVRYAAGRGPSDVVVWDADTGEELAGIFHRQDAPPTAIAPNRDGTHVAALFRDEVTAVDVATGRELFSLAAMPRQQILVQESASGRRSFLNSRNDLVHYSPDGQRLIIKPLWEMGNSTRQRPGISAAGRPQIFSAGGDLIRICDAVTGQELLSVSSESPLYADVWAHSSAGVLPVAPEEEAAWLVDWLATSTVEGRLLTRPEIAERIRGDLSLSQETRESALKLAARLVRRGATLAQSALKTATLSGQPREAYERALEWASETLQQDPDFGDALFAQGAAYYRLGKFAEAAVALAAARRTRRDAGEPARPENLAFLAMAHHQLGHVDEARRRFYQADQAMRVRTIGSPFALETSFRGSAQRRSGIAERLFEAAEVIGIRKAFELNVRGTRLLDSGDTAGALEALSEAVPLDPQNPFAFLERAVAWHKQGAIAAALKDLDEAHRLAPTVHEILDYRAWIRATCPDASFRDGKLAVADALRACELTDHRDPIYLATLAAAHAESGNFDEAVKHQQQANSWGSLPRERGVYQARLKLYQEGKPFHESPPDKPAAN